MLDRRQLNRLRLKYEHSVAMCRLCGRKGIVGEDLKLVDATPQTEASVQASEFFIRCVDPQACRWRVQLD